MPRQWGHMRQSGRACGHMVALRSVVDGATEISPATTITVAGTAMYDPIRQSLQPPVVSTYLPHETQRPSGPIAPGVGKLSRMWPVEPNEKALVGIRNPRRQLSCRRRHLHPPHDALREVVVREPEAVPKLVLECQLFQLRRT